VDRSVLATKQRAGTNVRERGTIHYDVSTVRFYPGRLVT
jgi:hypothetical protein